MKAYNLVIDGGTTHSRVTLVDERGISIAVVTREVGAARSAVEGNNRQLREALRQAVLELSAQWTDGSVRRCLAYGMITSREGLLEVPHCAAPAGAKDLCRAIQYGPFPKILPVPIGFIPGVKNFGGDVTLRNFSGMDMMRGEETEAIGLHALVQPKGDCLFVLPGSHNKLVRMDGEGRITGCMTTLSGELLSVLTRHSILAAAVDRSFASMDGYDPQMVSAGFAEAEAYGLGRAAFAGRILSTLGKLPPSAISCYLLGAVLQTDVQAVKAYASADTPLYIAGKEPVATALRDLLQAAGMRNVHAVSEDIRSRMGVTGALRIADACNAQ